MKTIKDIPAIPKHILLGNMSRLRNDRLALFQDVETLCGDIGLFHAGTTPVVMLNSHTVIHEAFVNHARSLEKIAVIKRYLDPFLGNGLLNINQYEGHARHRKHIAPFFYKEAIAAYRETIVSIVQHYVQHWVDGATININQAMADITLSIIGYIIFGQDLTTTLREMGQAFLQVVHHVNYQTTALIPTPLTWPTPANRRFRKAVATLDNIITTMIHQRRTTNSYGDDVLSRLLTTPIDTLPMPDAAIRDEIMTLLFAGHDTTANALMWTWVLLCDHPAIYQRLQEDVRSAQSSAIGSGEPIPFIGQIFKETLRLYPSVYILARQTTAPINIGGYQLPPQTRIGVSPFVIHRRERYYADPLRFNPDRFHPDSDQYREKYAYLPFSIGSHACIGGILAFTEAHLIIKTITEAVTLSRIDTLPVTPQTLITLQPHQPVLMRVSRT